MAKDKVCVFCGKDLTMFNSDVFYCGGTTQDCCKPCGRELNLLSEEEQCRRALRLGLADSREKLEAHLSFLAEVENQRPACLRCGAKLRFGEVLTLDNSPMRDGIFSSTFEVLPACCSGCGKMEFYNPGYARGNKTIAYLIRKDTGI